VLDLSQLQDQFSEFHAYQSGEQARRADLLQQALDALDACRDAWEDLREIARHAQPGWLVAGLRENPTARQSAPPRPTPLTVVATDGSQIYPDRHVEPHCYLLNVSRIAFQYGTTERPLMEAVPDFRFRRGDLEAFYEDVATDLSGKTTAEVVSALRDEQELEALFEVARASRIDGRPLVALADGTLIRWMLRRMQNRDLEQKLIARYAELLRRFQERGLPLCSYISMPGNTEVVNLLRVQRGEHEAPTPDKTTLDGLLDRWLFERRLQPGERTAVFESSSHIQREYGASDRICYFYLRTRTANGASEVGRVEVPMWVAEDAGLLDLVHATVLSECEKGEGYPMILSEAHERAVIRAKERELFYDLIERQMTRAGLRFKASNKQSSKRRPLV
jgi:hypothetical protein